MFIIYHSNQLDLLKDILVDSIHRKPLANPLEDEQILVQSPGMAQWLRQQMAEASGIAASVNFPLPASFLWQQFVCLLPDVPERSAFNKSTMGWKLVSLLPDMIDDNRFAPLRRFLADDHDGVRLYQLAHKVADLFDQYLVFRPEWIELWEKGVDSTAAEHPWQPPLWRALVAKTEQLGQSHWHRANMHRHFLSSLKQPSSREKLPKRVFVFGISALPPHFVETLWHMGQVIDVHLMVCNPCQHYWGEEKERKYLTKSSDDKTAPVTDEMFPDSGYEPSNPILASLGKLGRDYLYQLAELEVTEIDAFVQNNEKTVLEQVQNDILNLRSRTTEAPAELEQDDRSICFHSCHSPLREVELLHDQLLDLFEQTPTLSPRDVIVMLPDVDRYTPWIDAVFGGVVGGRDSKRFIPYAISDRSARRQYPLLDGLLMLLTIDQHRCSAQELLDLLEISAIQRRFSIDEYGYGRLRQWVGQSGVRWGLDGVHQQTFELPGRETNSWRSGLRRMLLGYAMPEEAGLFAGILPLDSASGMDAIYTGQLTLFVDELIALAETLNQPRSLNEWIILINSTIDTFFEPDDEDEHAATLARKTVEQLGDQLEGAGYNGELSRAVLLDVLTERFNSEMGSQRFLSGSVNFCTLMPMRSIPFQVVCLLGMNDGDYPRSVAPVGFDLMVKQSKRGDRSRRDDDRYLFLEALLSARQKLYISYVGRSVHDNTHQPPSVLVSELLEQCQLIVGKEAAKQKLVTLHPLQPFSEVLFSGENGHFSYAAEWLPTATEVTNNSPSFITTPLSERPPPTTLEITELLRFIQNPVRYFCQQRLRVYFEAGESELADTEPFNLAGLELYQLSHVLLKALVDGSADRFSEEMVASGQLPHAAFGELFLQHQCGTLGSLIEPIREAQKERAEDLEIRVTLDKLTLTGWLNQLTSSGPVTFRPAKLKVRDWLALWIKHLGYSACHPESQSSRHLALDGELHLKPVARETAIACLNELTTLYLQGMNQPLAFFPRTAKVWFDTAAIKPERAEQAAEQEFYGNISVPGEVSDPYIQRVYPVLDDAVYERLTELGSKVFSPIALYTDKTA